MVNEPFFPYMENYGTSKDIPVSQLWQLQRERTVLIDKYLKRWNSTADITTNGKPIDAIIMPATPFAGNPLGNSPHMLATHPHLMLLIILLVCSR